MAAVDAVKRADRHDAGVESQFPITMESASAAVKTLAQTRGHGSLRFSLPCRAARLLRQLRRCVGRTIIAVRSCHRVIAPLGPVRAVWCDTFRPLLVSA